METQIIELIAKDRLEIPLSSMYQKVKKTKSKDAKGLAAVLEQAPCATFENERVFAYVRSEDKEKARGMKEAVTEFAAEFPKYGMILLGKVAEKRIIAEKHLYFGVQFGKRLNTEDYIGVLQNLGLSEQTARSLYSDLLNVSRKLANAREEQRSAIVGKYANDAEGEE